MGLEEVKEEILNSSRAESDKIVAETRKEASEIMSKAKERVNDYKNKLKEDKKKLIESLEKMKTAQSRSEAKKLVLDKKKEIIDNAFEKARQKLSNLNDSERKKYIQNLIEKAEKEIEVATVYCNKKDRKFLQDFNCQDIDVIGGLIVENKDKSIRIDYSFETMIANIKDTSLQEITKILF